MKKIFILLVVIGGIAYGANTYATQLAEEGLYYSLSSSMQLHRSDVKVESDPGIKILMGTMDRVQVHGQDVRIGSMKLANFDCDLQGVHFDPSASVMDGKLTVMRANAGNMTASIRSSDLRQFLIDKVDKLSDVQIDFNDDAIHLTGTILLGGLLDAHANIYGSFGMEGNKLMFIPSTVSVEGLGMAYKLKLNNMEIYDFSGFPLGIRPDTVTMHNNMLTISGKVN